MGAVVLNGARLGADSLIAVGAVVLEGTEIHPASWSQDYQQSAPPAHH